MRMLASIWMLVGLCATSPRLAWAQAKIALDRVEPASPSSSLLTVPEPSIDVARPTPAAGVLLGYADAPLQVADKRSERAEVLNYQLVMYVQASLRLGRRFEFGLTLPTIFSQAGDRSALNSVHVAQLKGTVLGDLRATGQLGLFRQRGVLPAAGLLVTTWLPTGNTAAFAGSGQVRAGVNLLLGAELGAILWRASVGRQHQADSGVVLTGHSGWTSTIGAAYRSEKWQLGPELWGSTAADGRVRAFERRTTNLEALVAFRYRWSDFVFTAAAGPGLSHGGGTPRFRALLGVAYAPHSAPVPTTEEAAPLPAPTLTQTPHSSAPALVLDNAATAPRAGQARMNREGDSDADGIIDSLDACPKLFGAANADPTRHGCPLDTDHDGVADAEDACPNVAGAANNDSKVHGCPADRDGDGVVDTEDACPDMKGDRSTDPKLNGCKTAVTIQGTQLVLVQQIHFKTGSDEILGESDAVLQQLKQILEESPDIARVAVDGHTDNLGTEASNLSLSRRRAVAVVRWLVQHGIDERRLEARGFGPRQPLLPNGTENGRARNRRVEFNILKRTEAGSTGWRDGSIND